MLPLCQSFTNINLVIPNYTLQTSKLCKYLILVDNFSWKHFGGNIRWKIVGEKYLVENIQWELVSGKYFVEWEGTS